jgi:AraC-like DNA-binding protein/mannose-6-phosphate isomerase-like protein (cupin superfamily)
VINARIIEQVKNCRDRVSMRNVRPHEVDATPGALVATGNEYPARHQVSRHHHRRAQFLYAARGVASVVTELGSWIVPPERAVWIPAGIFHEVTMLGPVSMRSLYIDPEMAATLPSACRVVGVSGLLSQLMQEAVDLPFPYERGSRADLILSLLVHEIERAPEQPLNVPFPAEPRLAARCRAYLEHPSPHETIDDWCADLAMSRRSFTRHFRAETGFAFAAWCRQACLFAALPRLAAGEPITTIAFDLGYESASAFATMFRRTVGVAPSRYLSTTAS